MFAEEGREQRGVGAEKRKAVKREGGREGGRKNGDRRKGPLLSRRAPGNPVTPSHGRCSLSTHTLALDLRKEQGTGKETKV